MVSFCPKLKCISMNITEFSPRAWRFFVDNVSHRLEHLSIDSTVRVRRRDRLQHNYPSELHGQLFKRCVNLKEFRLTLFEYTYEMELRDLKFDFSSIRSLQPILMFTKYIRTEDNYETVSSDGFDFKPYKLNRGTLAKLLANSYTLTQFFRIEYHIEESRESLRALHHLKEFSALRGLNLKITHLSQHPTDDLLEDYYREHQEIFRHSLPRLETMTVFFEQNIDCNKLVTYFANDEVRFKDSLQRLRLENPKLNKVSFERMRKAFVNLECLQLINFALPSSHQTAKNSHHRNLRRLCRLADHNSMFRERREEKDYILRIISSWTALNSIIIENTTRKPDSIFVFTKNDFVKLIHMCHKLRYIRIKNMPNIGEKEEQELREIALRRGLKEQAISIYSIDR